MLLFFILEAAQLPRDVTILRQIQDLMMPINIFGCQADMQSVELVHMLQRQQQHSKVGQQFILSEVRLPILDMLVKCYFWSGILIPQDVRVRRRLLLTLCFVVVLVCKAIFFTHATGDLIYVIF